MTETRVKRILLAALLAIGGFVALFAVPAHTFAAINSQINFQGKLTNTDGTNVTNGTYSIVFSIYTVSSGGVAVWTETQPSVSVSDGIFQVSLGSVTALPGSVDFNSSSLYLGVKVGADAEMTPRIQFTAAPYAFNADRLGGIASTGYVQLSPGSQQTGFINISGNITSGGTYNTNTFTSSSLIFGAASPASIQSAASQALTLTANAASTFSTSSGQLTVQSGSGTLSLGTTTTLTANGALSVTSNTTNALTLDSGSTGAVNVGTGANAKAVTVGNTTAGTTVTNNVGTGTTAYTIQGASNTFLAINGTSNVIYVGGAASAATPTLFVFGSKTATGDPTGVNGGEYYNSANNRFRCYQGSIWVDCNNGFNTLTKTADQASPLSTTAFQNDNTLFFNVNANTTYVFDAWIPVNDSNTGADLKYTFTTPTGATQIILTSYYSNATSFVQCNIITSGQTCANTTVNRADHFIQVRGHVTVAATAGTVRFQFAQNTSTAAAFPVIKKGATLSWHQSN